MLTQWSILDIETTGLNPGEDAVIDVGFIRFDGVKKVDEYRSLVAYEGELSGFITELTGIRTRDLKRAPKWDEVLTRLCELEYDTIICHNAGFEKSFLTPEFESVGLEGPQFVDSIDYLAILFPFIAQFKLEFFIELLDLRECEVHRGFEDAEDMLKVILSAQAWLTQKADPEWASWIRSQLTKLQLDDWWFSKFFHLSSSQVMELASELEWELDDLVSKWDEYFHKEGGKKYVEEAAPLSTTDLPQFNSESIKNLYKKMASEMGEGHFEYRPSQEELSMRVGQSFKNNVHSLIQAPTGTGKTLGYLLPASLFALAEGKPVLMSTGTKTLQTQALEKDLPQLRKILGLRHDEFRSALLIGSSNHLCELSYRKRDDDLLLLTKPLEERLAHLYFENILMFNQLNPRAKLTRLDTPRVLLRKWPMLKELDREMAVDFRSCVGKACPYVKSCSYIQSLREAKDAHLIVGNHALMFQWPKGLPRPEHIIVDEAHRLEGEATKAFSQVITGEELSLTLKQLEQWQGLGALFYLIGQYCEDSKSDDLIAKIKEGVQPLTQKIQEYLLQLPDFLEFYFKKGARYSEEYTNELPMVSREMTDPQGLKIYQLIENLACVFEQLVEIGLPYSEYFPKEGRDDDVYLGAVVKWESFYSKICDQAQILRGVIQKSRQSVASLKFHERDGFELCSSPVNVGEMLYRQLLETSQSVVYTSATLANADGKAGIRGVEWSTGYCYLEGKRRFKTGFFLPAHFDYQNNSKVFLCDDTPHFSEFNFVTETLGPITKLMTKIGGRSLLLFSSRKRFERAVEYLLAELSEEHPLFIQGMGGKVVEEFRKSKGGVLIGMESFSEGIDIPGEDLQFLFIDKIPDLRQDLIINERRDFYQKNIGNEFEDYYLAGRCRLLHQKLGRLLRRETDYGGAIIVDSRTKRWKTRTMSKVIKLMEPYQIHRSSLEDACHEVENFLNVRRSNCSDI